MSAAVNYIFIPPKSVGISSFNNGCLVPGYDAYIDDL
jgi:hypothetical protein